MMDAMMYVIVTENLHDQAFIDKYTQGFSEDQMPEGVADNESLVAYLTGRKDGMAKTSEWAEKITKVPADTIRQLAREYATTKPAVIGVALCGISLVRTQKKAHSGLPVSSGFISGCLLTIAAEFMLRYVFYYIHI